MLAKLRAHVDTACLIRSFNSLKKIGFIIRRHTASRGPASLKQKKRITVTDLEIAYASTRQQRCHKMATAAEQIFEFSKVTTKSLKQKNRITVIDLETAYASTRQQRCHKTAAAAEQILEF